MMSGKAISLLIGLMVSALVIIAVGSSLAQTSIGAAPAPQVPAPGLAGDVKQVEGTIQKVSGDTVTLADGTELTLPKNLTIQRDGLKPGSPVKASYEDKNGQKMVTSIQVGPSR